MKLVVEFEDKKRIYKIPLARVLKDTDIDPAVIQQAVKKLIAKL